MVEVTFSDVCEGDGGVLVARVKSSELYLDGQLFRLPNGKWRSASGRLYQYTQSVENCWAAYKDELDARAKIESSGLLNRTPYRD